MCLSLSVCVCVCVCVCLSLSVCVCYRESLAAAVGAPGLGFEDQHSSR